MAAAAAGSGLELGLPADTTALASVLPASGNLVLQINHKALRRGTTPFATGQGVGRRGLRRSDGQDQTIVAGKVPMARALGVLRCKACAAQGRRIQLAVEAREATIRRDRRQMGDAGASADSIICGFPLGRVPGSAKGLIAPPLCQLF